MKVSQKLPEPDLRAWAGQHLEVSPHANRREARAACLRKVAEHQWLPPAAIEESHEYLARPNGDKIFPSLLEQAFHEEESRLRAEVEEFARGFFDLHPAPRQKRFQALMDQCSWSVNLRARLHGLAAGLEVDREVFVRAAPEQKDLAEHVCRLFTLSPHERAQRRWELLRELESAQEPWENAPGRRLGARSSRWEATARALQEDYSEVAALEPILVDELAIGAARHQRRRGQLPQVQPAAAGGVTASSNAPANTDQSGGSKWYIWTIVVVLISLARFANTGNRQPAPPLPRQVPGAGAHDDPWPAPDLGRLRKKREDEELRNLQKNWKFDPNLNDWVPRDEKDFKDFKDGFTPEMQAAIEKLTKLKLQQPPKNGPRNLPPVPMKPDAPPRPNEPGP